MDLLADVLAASGVRGTVAARIEAGESWGWLAQNVRGAAFHAVTSGTVWLGLPGQLPIKLSPGDVVLLPRGSEHRLGSDLEALQRGDAAATQADDGGMYRIGSGPVQAHVLCAHYQYDPAVSIQIFKLLPDLVHLRADHGGDSLSDTVRLLARELARPQLATSVVLDSLVDILLVQLLRVWLAARPEPSGPSWLGVLGDPLIGEAVSKLHQEPARDWTTAALAAAVNVSRATLTRRFPAVIGQTPGEYLTRWRMDLAARRLRDTNDTLEDIAQAVGYTSVYAFNRAFSRAHALSPGRYRIQARSESPSWSRRQPDGVARAG